MKKILALLLALLCASSLVACNGLPTDENGQIGGDVEIKSGIKLTDEFSFIPESDNDMINNKDRSNYVKLADIDSKYVTTKDEVTYLKYTAPVFEIGGAKHPDANGAKLSRINQAWLTRFENELVNKDALTYASHTAGVTIRFCTNASKISLTPTAFSSSFLTNSEYKEFVTQLGTQTPRVYVGSGTDRVVATTASGYYQLGTGYKEVLIYLPSGASVDSFEIGFPEASAQIASPFERAHKPIAFYGSDFIQGFQAQNCGSAFTNIVTRMLNVDCINLGFAGGAHGEQVIADYIASLDISAFVMAFDEGATLDELKENHYKFYKTVRDAHPDIPIVILSDPALSDEAFEASKERVAIIEKTFESAVLSGDDKVYFLDGNSVFGDQDIMDVYTTDMKLLNSTGTYYVAMSVYDILNSAFTPDTEKSGADRLPGLRDFIEFEADGSSLNASAGTFTKISNINSQYTSTVDGVTYVNYNMPYLTIGGIKHPSQNGGEFCRINVTQRDDFVAQCVEGNSYAKNSLTSWTSGVTMRFRTNADEIVIKANMINNSAYNIGAYTHMTGRGVRGFDVYVGTGNNLVYCGEPKQAMSAKDVMTTEVKLPGGYVEVMIEFPLYDGITSIEIGFKDTSAEIAAPLARNDKPVLFYGSSITEGACASRPGLAYHNLVTRMLGTDCINQGYSNSAHGEQIMANYIGTRDMSIFVMDYDHNAYHATELKNTHYEFYKTVRAAHPDIPIIMLTMPIFTSEPGAWQVERANIVKDTYNKAIAAGDNNVYYINGADFFPVKGLSDIYFVDSTHPSDIGMYYMAKAVYQKIVEIQGK